MWQPHRERGLGSSSSEKTDSKPPASTFSVQIRFPWFGNCHPMPLNEIFIFLVVQMQH